MIIVKQSSVSEIENIVKFQLAMAFETEKLKLDRDIVYSGVQAVYDDTRKGKYFVAVENNEVVASLMITYEWSDWRNGNVWWIQSVYVVPEYRGKGVFRIMYEHLKELVEKDSTLRGLRLYVDKSNSGAQKVYEKIGMNGQHYQMFEWMK